VPCTHPPARHIPVLVVRELLRAVGVETCPNCHQVLRIRGKGQVIELDRYRAVAEPESDRTSL
jgi:hypothetical protein